MSPEPTHDEPVTNGDRLAKRLMLMKKAAVAQTLASLMVGFSGVQIVGFPWVPGSTPAGSYVTYVLIGFGVVGVFLAANQFKARRWAEISSAVFGFVMMLVNMAWVSLAIVGLLGPGAGIAHGGGLLPSPTCVMYLAVPLTCFSALLSAFAVSSPRT